MHDKRSVRFLLEYEDASAEGLICLPDLRLSYSFTGTNAKDILTLTNMLVELETVLDLLKEREMK